MILDKELMFSEEQAVTASAASTNIIDLGEPSVGDYGNAQEGEIFVNVDEAVTAAGAATVTFQLQTDDNEGFASPTTLVQSDAIGKASLTLNSQHFRVKIPKGIQRYVRVYYSVGTGPLTAGKFTTSIVNALQANL